jgi:mycothiol synthase
MTTINIATKLRPFTLADAQAAVDLFNAYSQAIYGWNDAEVNDLIREWTFPGMDIDELVRVLEDDQGRIIGYVEVWDTTKPHVTKYVWGIMHPDHWDAEIYRDMLAWGEDCARARVELAPSGARVTMSLGAPSKDNRRKAAYESLGAELVRHFYRMEIDLQDPPMAPVIPDGFTIVPINLEAELEAAIVALEDGFTDHWGWVEHPIDEVIAQWRHFIENDRDFDPSLMFLAKTGDEIVGACFCSPKRIEDPGLAWVNQLSVRRAWRKHGLGRALLLTAFQAFYQRGKQRAGLFVDAASLTNATRLYEKAGMHVTLQSDNYMKELRAGEDITTT